LAERGGFVWNKPMVLAETPQNNLQIFKTQHLRISSLVQGSDNKKGIATEES
jgi:hypothetical protein